MKITLRAARVNKGYTQAKLAEMMNTTRQTIQNYENGKTSPRYEIIRRLALILDIDIDNIEMPKRKK
jgi:transcriptional regulator with XRE-family HTH domain